jgi:hypothetical protein
MMLPAYASALLASGGTSGFVHVIEVLAWTWCLGIFVSLIVTRGRRGLHDMILKCVIIRSRSEVFIRTAFSRLKPGGSNPAGSERAWKSRSASREKSSIQGWFRCPHRCPVEQVFQHARSAPQPFSLSSSRFQPLETGRQGYKKAFL